MSAPLTAGHPAGTTPPTGRSSLRPRLIIGALVAAALGVLAWTILRRDDADELIAQAKETAEDLARQAAAAAEQAASKAAEVATDAASRAAEVAGDATTFAVETGTKVKDDLLH